MKKLITTVCLSIAICVGSVGASAAADLQKGLEDAKPLAERGDAEAQYALGEIQERKKAMRAAS